MGGALTFISLFSGIGGIDIGLERAGWECVGQVENNEYCQEVLKKHWPDVPRCPDIRNITGGELGHADLICGGFPCQDISTAGKGTGLTGERSGLWFEMARIIAEAQPKYVLIENVPALARRGLDIVGETLRVQGYQPLRPILIEAASVGAPHKRERIFIVAVANSMCVGPRNGEPYLGPTKGGVNAQHQTPRRSENVANPSSEGLQRATRKELQQRESLPRSPELADTTGELGNVGDDHRRSGREQIPKPGNGSEEARPISDWWAIEPDVGRVADGIPSRVDRLKALGNAVVPQVAEYIGRMIMELDDIARGPPSVSGGEGAGYTDGTEEVPNSGSRSREKAV